MDNSMITKKVAIQLGKQMQDEIGLSDLKFEII